MPHILLLQPAILRRYSLPQQICIRCMTCLFVFFSRHTNACTHWKPIQCQQDHRVRNGKNEKSSLHMHLHISTGKCNKTQLFFVPTRRTTTTKIMSRKKCFVRYTLTGRERGKEKEKKDASSTLSHCVQTTKPYSLINERWKKNPTPQRKNPRRNRRWTQRQKKNEEKTQNTAPPGTSHNYMGVD